METHNVSLKDIKLDPRAHKLASSGGTRPYLDCFIKAYRDNAVDSKPRSKSYETCR
jgi:hypothetical protein